MTDIPGNIVAAQVQALLEQLRGHQVKRVDALLDGAHEIARDTVGREHRRSRQHVADVVRRERARLSEAERQAAARALTHERLERQKRSAALLEQAWRRLPAALEARWGDAEGRHAWCAALLGRAQQFLLQGPWQVQHPVQWDDGERAAVGAIIAAHCAVEPQFEAQPDIVAGLRILTSEALLDGTVPGLLALRTEVEAQLLAELSGDGAGATHPAAGGADV